MPLLEVRDLRTHFHTRAGVVKAVDGVSFAIEENETLGIVGESGSGKSVTALTVMGLVPKPAGRVVGGQVLFEGKDLLTLDPNELRQLRGAQLAMVLQDPFTSLNPVYKVGDQIAETMLYHPDHFRQTSGLEGVLPAGKASLRRAVAQRVIELLRTVRIPAAEHRVNQYPHQFSGGMKQRSVISVMIACRPRLLIADEPTTALDVTVQAQVLRVLKGVQKELKMALMLITHDLGLVARYCDQVAVMYAGRIVEYGAVGEVFKNPSHPYTRGLLGSLPRLTATTERLVAIEGQPPDLMHLPPGCAFRPRCPHAMPICGEEYPPEFVAGERHASSCWLLAGEVPRHG